MKTHPEVNQIVSCYSQRYRVKPLKNANTPAVKAIIVDNYDRSLTNKYIDLFTLFIKDQAAHLPSNSCCFPA